MENISLNFVHSISDIGKKAWNAVAGIDNPFTRYEFLWALEESGCTTAETGWAPHHVVVYKQTDGEEKVIAVMPLYLKTNSWGEYVFDWSWANAYKSYGFEYYPKFVSAVPFTPSYGNRVFIESGEQTKAIIKLIRDKVIEKGEFIGASSWHILFPTESEHQQFGELGILPRIASQFHWFNKDYKSFDDFLQALSSRKRKNIRKERQQVKNQGVTFETVNGADINELQWEKFNQFYQSTYMMRGMQGYLNVEFFQMLSETMPEQLFMVIARQDKIMIAASLFFRSSEKVMGRYWGSARDYQFLHFETCYYQGQDYCIEHGLKSFDAGAQGEHKIQRGFEPIITYSNHWLANQGFSEAIDNFLSEERTHIEEYIEQARAQLPLKK